MEVRLGGPFAWSTPDDPARWVALVGALAVLGWRGHLTPRIARWIERLAPAVAAFLSAGYVVHVLRGGPRIIDATAYALQARWLADGALTLPLSEPEHAVLGRFLVRSATDTPAASVLFPPGWPAVLSVGMRLGVPLAIGPLIGALLCAATARLARIAARSLDAPDVETKAGALASVLSVLCAALRYHTADTMSHGLAALCLTAGLGCAWLALERDSAWFAALSGLAAGGLVATRPVSALALAAMLVTTLATVATGVHGARRIRLFGAFLAGTCLPVALWFAHQHAATGSFLATAQGRYYATSDGPPGCFRYGFGAGIGCEGEHGDFVEAHLRSGYGVRAALGTTGRRLLHHVSDPMNFGPLFALVLASVRVKSRLGRVAFLGVAVQLVVYAPFYFDGSYPGGGARLYADVLPLEHVLATLALVAPWQVRNDTERAVDWPTLERRARPCLALMLLGIAVGVGADHVKLRDREGGRPMFDEAVLERAGVDLTRDLVFLDTDHGFGLAHGPGRHVVRTRGDDLDRLAWEQAGRLRAFAYHYDFRDGTSSLEPRVFDERPTRALSLRIEGESLWPPRAQANGYAWPTYRVPSCASRGRGLELRGPSETAVRLALPSALVGRTLTPTVTSVAEDMGEGTLRLESEGEPIAEWRFAAPRASGCVHLDAVAVPKERAGLELVATGRGWALDELVFSEMR